MFMKAVLKISLPVEVDVESCNMSKINARAHGSRIGRVLCLCFSALFRPADPQSYSEKEPGCTDPLSALSRQVPWQFG